MAIVALTKEVSTDGYRVWSATLGPDDTMDIPIGGGCRMVWIYTETLALVASAVMQNVSLGTEGEEVQQLDDANATIPGIYLPAEPDQMGHVVNPPAMLRLESTGSGTDTTLVIVEAHYTITRPRGRGR